MSQERFEMVDADAVIVGAGPSGLLSAIGLLKKNPNRKVMLLEKRPEYNRKHVVRFKHTKFSEYVKAIGGEDIPEFQKLEEQLKISPAIRINELEGILSTVAKRMGAQIKYEEFQDLQTLSKLCPKLELVIGCDGTHSAVSDKVFGKENQIREEFDYVLQVRFEISGPLARKVDLPTWPAYLQAYGLAGEEILGKTVDGKTPITMQIMIPKDEFDALKPYATSKEPIRPFNDPEEKLQHIPPEIMKKVKGYLGFRLSHYTKHQEDEFIDMSEVRLSVNAAPATRAKTVVTHQTVTVPDSDQKREICVMLAGDAALGLSYFNGMNSCFENIVQAQAALHAQSEELKEKLDEYQTWFDEDLAPRKVKEVADYSKKIARRIERSNIFLNWLLGPDFIMNTAQAERYAELYYLNQREAMNKKDTGLSEPYPHRKNYFFPILNSTPVPLLEYGKQISDHFSKYFRVYKSNYYLYSDLLQPLNALRHMLVGAAKIIISPLAFLIYLPISLVGFMFTVYLNLATMAEFKVSSQEIKVNFETTLRRMADGLAEIGLGIVLASTTIMWPIKVIANLALTKINASRQIENNTGMVRIVNEAEILTKEEGFSTNRAHALLIDAHRKFEKSLGREQETQISIEMESQAYQACKLDNPESYKSYFRLFRAGDSGKASDPIVEEVLSVTL